MGICRLCHWRANFFFGGGGGELAKRLLGGFGGMLHPKNFFESCNLVRFGAYFHNFLISKSLKIFIYYTKIMIKCSHVLARGSRSMIHCLLIIFIKGCNFCNVFDTISTLIFFINIHFLFKK